jgi:hypothetical protein
MTTTRIRETVGIPIWASKIYKYPFINIHIYKYPLTEIDGSNTLLLLFLSRDIPDSSLLATFPAPAINRAVRP